MRGFNVRLPDELKAQATRLAEQQGLGFSEYVRQALVFRMAIDAILRADPERQVDVAAIVRILAGEQPPDT